MLTALWVACQSALLLVTLAVTALTLFLYYNPTVRRNTAIAKGYPQPRGLPFLGHLLHVVKPRGELFWILRKFRDELGSRYCVLLFSQAFFSISDPEAIEVVLSSSKHIQKGRVYKFLKPWLGQGLLTSEGKLWHTRRKLLTPAFHFRILDQFSGHLEEQAARLVDELDALCAEAEQVADWSVDVVPVVSRVTLRSICVTAMGSVDFRTDGVGSEKSYFDAIHRLGTATVERTVRPWLWPPIFFWFSSKYNDFRKDLRTLHGFTKRVIADRKKKLLEDIDKDADAGGNEDAAGRRKSRLRPFLDVLLRAQRDGADLSDSDIREEVDTFMFEGHDTTSMAICWGLEILGRNIDVQDKLAAELRSAGSDWESISKLPYLDRVFKECLRLRPSVPFISRSLEQDAVLPNGQILPAHATINIPIYDLHRHPEHFPDPERFDPDRFLPEKEINRHPFAYVPFSAGPRNCIGKRFAVMEVKLLIAAVVRRFNIRTATEDKDFIADLVLRPRDGVRLRLTPRCSESPGGQAVCS